MLQESGTRKVLNWVLPGLIAGLVFAMWAMVVGLFTSTLWAPPQGIAQSIGVGTPGHNFQLVPFVVGLMGHMMNSIVLGAGLIAIAGAPLLQGPLALAGGAAYGLAWYPAVSAVWPPGGLGPPGRPPNRRPRWRRGAWTSRARALRRWRVGRTQSPAGLRPRTRAICASQHPDRGREKRHGEDEQDS